MPSVIGSIDNAWKRGKTTYIHHLIFTEDSLLIFDIFHKKELRKEITQYLMSDPLTLAPFAGAQSYALYRDSKQINQHIISEAIDAGIQIEKNLDSEISREPPEFQRIGYAEIKSVTLGQGKHLELPFLTIQTDGENIKYHLMHNNYEKLAHLDDETFKKYADTLKNALGEKVEIKG